MPLKAARENPEEMLSDDTDWADRSEYWTNYRTSTRGASKKFKYREPLILCGYGVNVRVDHNTLLVRNGFTHYPQKAEQFRYFPGDANLPDRIVILDASGGISFDALNWMSEQQIELVQLDWRGQVTNIGLNSGYAGNSKLIARNLITQKIATSLETLKVIIPKSEKRDFAISQLNRKYSEIRELKKQFSISNILGIEGACAAAYFAAWQGLPIKWSGFKRKPVPDNWFEIIPRKMGWRTRSQNARHPVNAMLNYGYGIIVNHVRTQVIAAGFDPSIGVLHGNAQNRIPLVYDLMEPLRPVVDRVVLGLALSHTFTPGDFTINKYGGCRLNPQMAKLLVELHGSELHAFPIIKSHLKQMS